MKQKIINDETNEQPQEAEQPEAAEEAGEASHDPRKFDPMVVEDLNRTRIELADAMKDEADKKRIHKASKERVEALADREHELVNELFDGRDQPSLPYSNEPDERWRREPLGCLLEHGASAATLKSITEKKPEINTLGTLSDWLNGGHELQEIEGIGMGKAEAVKDALTAWFAAHPDMCPPVKGEGSTEMSLLDVVDEEDDEEQSDAA